MEIQDNVSKAAEITSRLGIFDSYNVKLSALEMAEWKDQQFKEYLEKKRDKWQLAYQETQDSDYYAVFNTLDEIINELFGE